jgi:hypothetical protein
MLDDFKPKKPAAPARISRKPEPETEAAIDLDTEIGDAFAPPDAVAAADQAEDTDEPIIIDDEDEAIDEIASPDKESDKKSKAPKGPKVKWHWWPLKSWTKKQALIVGGVGLVILIAIVAVLFLVVFNKKPQPQAAKPAQKTEKKEVKPTTIPSPLTGTPIPADQKNSPVTGIMIENSLEARPQAGLKDAGVVFEAVAEGGITRFLALYQEAQPDYVGPIRSARPYYVDWLLPFDASYAHVGGSPDAISKIRNSGVKDIDQFYNAGAYRRVNNRYAPHDVFSSLSDLIKLQKTKGYDKSNFTGFTRKAEAASKTPTATVIDFTISGPAFSVHYDYDAATNSYKRGVGGAPHTDEKTGAQLSPKVVIAMVMDQSTDADGLHTVYNTTGTGSMYVFQDGIFTIGTWTKNDAKSQFSFVDEVGKPLNLNPGQTWISVVGLTGNINYK